MCSCSSPNISLLSARPKDKVLNLPHVHLGLQSIGWLATHGTGGSCQMKSNTLLFPAGNHTVHKESILCCVLDKTLHWHRVMIGCLTSSTHIVAGGQLKNLKIVKILNFQLHLRRKKNVGKNNNNLKTHIFVHTYKICKCNVRNSKSQQTKYSGCLVVLISISFPHLSLKSHPHQNGKETCVPTFSISVQSPAAWIKLRGFEPWFHVSVIHQGSQTHSLSLTVLDRGVMSQSIPKLQETQLKH